MPSLQRSRDKWRRNWETFTLKSLKADIAWYVCFLVAVWLVRNQKLRGVRGAAWKCSCSPSNVRTIYPAKTQTAACSFVFRVIRRWTSGFYWRLDTFCEVWKRGGENARKLTIRSHHVMGRNILFSGLGSVLGAVPPVHTLISLGRTTAARFRNSTVNACNR